MYNESIGKKEVHVSIFQDWTIQRVNDPWFPNLETQIPQISMVTLVKNMHFTPEAEISKL